MDRKKKKANAASAAVNAKQQQINLFNRFADRIRQIIDLFANKALAHKVPPIFIQKLFEVRYPVLKAKSGGDIPKSRIIQFNKLMNQMIADNEITLLNGNVIPLSWYLSEALVLITAVSASEPDSPLGYELTEVFSPYFPDTPLHEEIKEMVHELSSQTCISLSDFNQSILQADYSNTPAFSPYETTNDIIVYSFKPVKEDINIEGQRRTAIRLGWVDIQRNWVFSKVKPSLLGFKVGSLDIPLPVYFQDHLLESLQKRIDITPGMMHIIMYLIFNDPKIPHHFKGNETLVSFPLADEKVGYLVVRLHQDKLFIHTFLFLTNDGTPEGDKLNKLLEIKLDKNDKSHLQIDTLPAFNAYAFEQNEQLFNLFKDAGCASLFKLSNIQEFTLNHIKEKDPESILQYLADTAYFRNSIKGDQEEPS